MTESTTAQFSEIKPDFSQPYDRLAELEQTHLEESVLCGIITDADISKEALGMAYIAQLLPLADAFQHRNHRLIYACCLKLHSEGLKPTLQALALRLASDGLLEDVGGRNKLVRLMDTDLFAVQNLKQNAGFLAEAYQRRRLIESLGSINKEGNLDTALEKALSEIEQLQLLRGGDKLSNQSMRTLIVAVIERNLGEADLREALNDLAKACRWNPKEVRELVELVESELEAEESRSERYQELEQLEKYKGRTLNLTNYLPQSYAAPMSQVAKWLGVPTAALLLEIMVGAASSAHPETRQIVKECTGFVEPAIIYGGLVAESGGRKSPTINAIFDTIRELQAEEEARFRLEMGEYNREYAEWMKSRPDNDDPEYQSWKNSGPTEPRPLREFIVQKVTTEAIDKIKGQQPDTAFVMLKDELSGLVGSYGAYKNGRGEDREGILSGWNGRGVKKNLKGGERVSVLLDAMSIFGAIQLPKLQQLMGNSVDDVQGDWARFLWALMPDEALRLPESDTKFELTFLKPLFKNIRSLQPQKYRFAFDAQRMYDDFHFELEKRRKAHPMPGMKAAIAKMEGYTARIALVLHLIWEVEAGRVPAPYVTRERVQQAIKLAEFFLSQVTLIHSEGVAALGEGGLTPRLSAMVGKLKQYGELTARKVQAAISWLRKVNPNNLRQDLMELAKLGYGTLVGNGNRIKLVLNQTADTADKTVDQTVECLNEPETLDVGEIQSFTVDTVDSADSVDSLHPHPGDSPSDELGESPQSGLPNSSPNQQYQQYQQLAPNPDPAPLTTADTVSTVLSTVESAVGGELPQRDDCSELADVAVPTRSELAAQILQCQTWVEVVSLLEAAARGTKKPKEKVFNAVTKILSVEQRQHLVRCLAVHLHEYPRDTWAYRWLPPSAKKLVVKAKALAPRVMTEFPQGIDMLSLPIDELIKQDWQEGE